jgi:hypothetical protein
MLIYTIFTVPSLMNGTRSTTDGQFGPGLSPHTLAGPETRSRVTRDEKQERAERKRREGTHTYGLECTALLDQVAGGQLYQELYIHVDSEYLTVEVQVSLVRLWR